MMPDAKIRRATQSDAHILACLNKDVQQIHADAYPYLFKQSNNIDEIEADFRSRVLADEDGFVLILEADHQAVGYIYARIVTRPENAYIHHHKWMIVDNIGVKSGYQNKGYGRKLMNAVRDEALARGIRRVLLDVYEFNANAQQFYAKMGFERMKIQMTLDLDQQ